MSCCTLGGGRRGECHNGSFTDVADDGAYAPVFGPEVVSPFGDAVSFVNGVKGYLYLFQELDVLVFGEGFRSYIE